MKIGYSVEGSTDRAVIVGLKDRWCPEGELIQGTFRGRTHLSLRREYPRICKELAFKGADVLVFMTDSNDQRWRDVKRNEVGKFPPEFVAIAIHGVASRNVECWICSNPGYVARRLSTDPAGLAVEDPKGAFESAAGIRRDDKRETLISELVREAPLGDWLRNDSFEDFYEQVRQQSKRLGCGIENLRDAKTGR